MKRNQHINLSGKIFGRWEVNYFDTTKSRKRRWNCKCICGTERSVSEHSLINGLSKSCGCLQREITSKAFTKHGKSQTKEYGIWSSMKGRCLNDKDKQYRYYGGRGITVCESWIKSFQRFYSDMGPSPGKGYSIERIDNDGNYEPDNCKWATREEQMNNRRSNHFLEYNGERKTTAQWAKETGIPIKIILNRIDAGWTDCKRILTKPKPNIKRLISYNGNTMNVEEWSRLLGIKSGTIYRRIQRGECDPARILMEVS